MSFQFMDCKEINYLQKMVTTIHKEKGKANIDKTVQVDLKQHINNDTYKQY